MSVPTPHDEPPFPTPDAPPFPTPDAPAFPTPGGSAHATADEPTHATEHADPSAVAAHVTVVRGDPDEVELAALVAGLVATAVPHDEPPASASAWTDRRRTLPRRPAPAPGPDTWRWSLHP